MRVLIIENCKRVAESADFQWPKILKPSGWYDHAWQSLVQLSSAQLKVASARALLCFLQTRDTLTRSRRGVPTL